MKGEGWDMESGTNIADPFKYVTLQGHMRAGKKIGNPVRIKMTSAQEKQFVRWWKNAGNPYSKIITPAFIKKAFLEAGWIQG